MYSTYPGSFVYTLSPCVPRRPTAQETKCPRDTHWWLAFRSDIGSVLLAGVRLLQLSITTNHQTSGSGSPHSGILRCVLTSVTVLRSVALWPARNQICRCSVMTAHQSKGWFSFDDGMIALFSFTSCQSNSSHSTSGTAST